MRLCEQETNQVPSDECIKMHGNASSKQFVVSFKWHRFRRLEQKITRSRYSRSNCFGYFYQPILDRHLIIIVKARDFRGRIFLRTLLRGFLEGTHFVFQNARIHKNGSRQSSTPLNFQVKRQRLPQFNNLIIVAQNMLIFFLIKINLEKIVNVKIAFFAKKKTSKNWNYFLLSFDFNVNVSDFIRWTCLTYLNLNLYSDWFTKTSSLKFSCKKNLRKVLLYF